MQIQLTYPLTRACFRPIDQGQQAPPTLKGKGCWQLVGDGEGTSGQDSLITPHMCCQDSCIGSTDGGQGKP